MKPALWILAAMGLWLNGCVSPGERLEPSVVNRIVEGKTLRIEVEHLLGRPDETWTGSDRETVVGYSFYRFLPRPDSGGNSDIVGSYWQRSVSFLYDSDEVVIKKTFYETERPIYSAQRRVWIGRALTSSDLESVQAGQTSFADLMRRWGRPSVKGLNLRGVLIYTWDYARAKDTSGLNTKGQAIHVYFDNDGKVIDYRIEGELPVPAREL
jgi:hypothetical protein